MHPKKKKKGCRVKIWIQAGDFEVEQDTGHYKAKGINQTVQFLNFTTWKNPTSNLLVNICVALLSHCSYLPCHIP